MSDRWRRLIGMGLLVVAIGITASQALLASCSPAVGAPVVERLSTR